MSIAVSKQTVKSRSERTRPTFKYRVHVLEDAPETLGGFEKVGLEVKLGKGRLTDFPTDAKVLDVVTTQEPLPMDVEVNAKYSHREGKTIIVRRRSLKFQIEKLDSEPRNPRYA